MDVAKTLDFYCDFVLNDKIKVKKEIETENVLAFHHTKPFYTTQIVIIPKQHIAKLADIENFEIIKEIFEVIQQIIKRYDLDKTNFKVLTNGGKFQDSKHLHFHLISDKPGGKDR